tara:strand:+ start:1378 stop:2211 length:834 start_codon:yes stop_codon:yes gene_type:complete
MKKNLFITIWVLFFSVNYAFAQITISPTNIFIEENTKFGTYLVINGSNEPQEVSVEFLFAYTATDKTGKRSVVYDDSVRQQQHSADSWIRSFPKTFTLQPSKRQVVRLRVSPAANLADGTYWARVKTTSTAQTPPIELQEEGAVSAKVGYTIEQITGLYFKKGNVTTDIQVTSTRTELSEDKNTLAVISDLIRGGNSPFLGSITANVMDRSGKIVASSFRSTTIYFSGTHRQEVDISELPSGSYTVEMTFESQRSDVATQDIVSMAPEIVKTQFIKN